MAENDAENIYHTTLGDFTEIAPRVYASETVNPKSLTVSAAVSKTGKDEQIQVNPQVFIYTDADSKLGPKLGEELQKDPTAYYNSMSLIGSFAKATFVNRELKLVNHAPDALERMANGRGAVTKPTSKDGSGFIRLESDSNESIKLFTGIGPEYLNIPKAYMDALASQALAHEEEHLIDPKNRKTTPTLNIEITGDLKSLHKYFNKDFTQFVMDLRAIGSLNYHFKNDDHAIHIWSEEFKSGVMPTLEQVADISSTPDKIHQIALQAIQQSSPGMTEETAQGILSTASKRYGCYKALREYGAFDNTPYANEFVDKYLSAAERLYKPILLENSELDAFRKYLAPMVSSPAPISAPAIPGP